MREPPNPTQLLSVCGRIAKLCAETFPTLDLPRADETARLRAALFARALELYHAVVQLAQAGLAAPVRVVVRSLLEVSFYDAALTNGNLTADELFAQHDHWRLKFSNKARHQFSEKLRRGLEGVTEHDQEALRKRIAESQVPELSILEVARRGGREDQYWSMFEHFSATVHVTTRDVSKHFVDGRDGLRLIVGSQRPDPTSLHVAATTMLRMAVALAALVGLDITADATKLMKCLASLAPNDPTDSLAPPNMH